MDRAFIGSVQARLQHRGPDDQGYLVYSERSVQSGRVPGDGSWSAEVLLVHARLSILDLGPDGWQPMPSADGRYHIVYNGEIYNFVELREELEALGHRFRSTSDTEVLLAAYVEWGAACLTRLVGMFAFAILDTRERSLFLARDFFGIKPLYYAPSDRGLAFASEIKVLRDFPGVSPRVNPRRAFNYLAYGVCDGGIETMLEGVRQLPAGHYLEVRLDGGDDETPVRYWGIEATRARDISFDEAAERVRDLFLDSVRLHLRSDVPVGAALSGGIDSSAIVAAMREVGGANLDIHAFSFIADNPDLNEERWVDLLATATGAKVHKVFAGHSELAQDLDGLLETQDEPFGGTSIYAQNRVFRAAREAGIKVMLDGQGADELLAGYRMYAAPRFASLVSRGHFGEALRLRRATAEWGRPVGLLRESLPYLAPNALRQILRRLGGGRSTPPAWLDLEWFEQHGVRRDPPRHRRGRDRLRDELRWAVTETILPALLRYEDRNSMAYSIESRVPFLTPELATFVFSLPEEYLLASDGTSKAVFRRAMRGIVPDAILDRRDKIGFATPERDWITALRPLADSVLDNGRPLVPPLLRSGVAQEWDAAIAGAKPFDERLWRMLNLEAWSRKTGVVFE